MPNLNGFDLYDAVRKIDNKVKAFFLQRLEKDILKSLKEGSHLLYFLILVFIRKPIRMDDLVKKVNEVI